MAGAGAALAAGLLRPTRALAIGDDDRVGIALLALGNGPAQRPGAVEQLLWETSKRTSIDVREKPALLLPGDRELFRHPLLVLIGLDALPPLPDAEVERLSRYVRAGGCLYLDDASAVGVDAFDASARALVARLFPDRPLARLSNDHTLFRSFFLLERPFGRLARTDFLEGVELDDRTGVVYGRNDLFGAFARDPGGGWRFGIEAGGDEGREMAFRMGINVVMYATCLGYKRDQVHVTEILRRRKWRVDEGGVLK